MERDRLQLVVRQVDLGNLRWVCHDVWWLFVCLFLWDVCGLVVTLLLATSREHNCVAAEPKPWSNCGCSVNERDSCPVVKHTSFFVHCLVDIHMRLNQSRVLLHTHTCAHRALHTTQNPVLRSWNSST